MKFLMVFIDMFRPNLLNIWNTQAVETEIDRRLRRWGGTTFQNCYTPAPDTPRSHGCLWSGCYPKENGCNTRIKYPLYYLLHPQECFLSLLRSAGYTMNFYMHKSAQQLGVLPQGFGGVEVSDEVVLHNFLQNLALEEDSLTYLCLEDYHAAVTDWFSTPQARVEGNKLIDGALSEIEDTVGIDAFDYIIMFSDHGWKISTESMEGALQQLGDNRTQIFMMIREKWQKELSKDVRLCSIMDIAPTICEMAGVPLPYEIDGRSLLGKEESPYVLIEDHRTFSVSLEQVIEYWGIRTKEGLACVDCKEVWQADYELSEEEMTTFSEVLAKRASFFTENTQAMQVLNYYQNHLDTCTVYYDGTQRRRHPSWKKRLKTALSPLMKPLTPLFRRLTS